MILGIDEAGRGPWAGPLVVGAVVLGGAEIEGLDDSKKVTKNKREILYGEIISKALCVSSGWVSAQEIDDLGMTGALKLATRRAVEKISVPYTEIIIDGTVNFLADTNKGRYAQTLAKADQLIPSVSAASIIAKVERDRYMFKLEAVYPGYGFSSNAGYGVASHRYAIAAIGITPEHRMSFRPIKKIISGSLPEATATVKDSSIIVGTVSESTAADYLVDRGHSILSRNWKTKYCEIDIVSILDDTVFFSEVKHRSSNVSGDGLSAITSKKLRQMTFAARMFCHLQHCSEMNQRLLAISTTGSPPKVVSMVEIL